MITQRPEVDIERIETNTPEKQLVLYVILRAIADVARVRNTSKSAAKEIADAKAWIYSNSLEPFSFVWCLDILNARHIEKSIKKLVNELEKPTKERISIREGFAIELKRIKTAGMKRSLKGV